MIAGLCDGSIVIPMSGRAESLNAALAAAIIMYEMTREKAGEDMASLQYRIWLTTLKGIGPKKAARLLDRFGTPEKYMPPRRRSSRRFASLISRTGRCF